MLNIYKNEAVAEATVTQADVREKELDYFMNNYWTWATTSTIFAGFSFDQLNNKTPDEVNPLLELVYLICTTVCLCSNLCVITWAAFMCIWGPGLALRGSKGMDSFHASVQFLQEQQITVYRSFRVGVLTFFCSSLTNVWVFPSRTGVNICCSVLFGIFLLMIIIFGILLHYRLKGGLITGGLISDELTERPTDGRIHAFSKLSRVGDLDRASTQYFTANAAERTRGRAQAASSSYMTGSFAY